MSNSESWTIGRLLTWTTDYLSSQGCDTPRLDAEILLAEASSCQRIELYTRFEDEADEIVRTSFRELVRRRAEGTPVAYLTGQREFYSLSFFVTPDVLIPRPETEFLVVAMLDRAKTQKPHSNVLSIADVGTGSGILAICAAKKLAESEILAIDISSAALDVAQKNAENHQVFDGIEFQESDLFEKIDPNRQFDFIVSNPPYISEEEMAELMPEVKDYEPHLALSAGASGLSVIERLIPQATERLYPGGWLFMEVSPMIHPLVQDILAKNSHFEVHQSMNDLAGHPRVVIAQRK